MAASPARSTPREEVAMGLYRKSRINAQNQGKRRARRFGYTSRPAKGEETRAMIWKRFTRCAANVAATIGIAFLLQGLTAASAASAAEIKVMSTVAMSATLDELKAKFEPATGNKVTIA